MRLSRRQKIIVSIITWIALVLIISLFPISSISDSPLVAPTIATVISLLSPRISDKVIDLIFGKDESNPKRKVPQLKPEPNWVAKVSELDQRPDLASELDPRFSHVFLLFFYPKTTLWERGERNPHENMPRDKVVVNSSTNEVFWYSPYVHDLFIKNSLICMTDSAENNEEMIARLKSKQYKLRERPATIANLLRKSDTPRIKHGFFSRGPEWVKFSPSQIEAILEEYKEKYRLLERETLLGINTLQPHLEVIMVHPRYALRTHFLNRRGITFPSGQRLIINHNTKLAYRSPPDDLHLWADGVLRLPKPMFAVSWTNILKNYAEQKDDSGKKTYTYVSDHPPSDEELLAGAKR